MPDHDRIWSKHVALKEITKRCVRQNNVYVRDLTVRLTETSIDRDALRKYYKFRTPEIRNSIVFISIIFSQYLKNINICFY